MRLRGSPEEAFRVHGMHTVMGFPPRRNRPFGPYSLKADAPSARPNPQARFLTCGKARSCSFSAAPDGCKIKLSLTDAITCLILDNTVAACGFWEKFLACIVQKAVI